MRFRILQIEAHHAPAQLQYRVTIGDDDQDAHRQFAGIGNTFENALATAVYNMAAELEKAASA